MAKKVKLKHEAPWIKIQSSAEDWTNLGRSGLMKIFHLLHLIRAFEQELLQLEKEGLTHGPVHSSIGQEGGAVGSVLAMQATDQMNGSHRGHHQFLAKALAYVGVFELDPCQNAAPEHIKEVLQKTLAEIMGLAQGYCCGRGGSMHLRWKDAGCLGTNAIVGGGVPLAAGVAWSRKHQNSNDAVFTCYGDGSAHIGSVQESLNLAAIWKLPLCFFVENNGYAVATTVAESAPDPRLSLRAAGSSIPAFLVDGMDPVAVMLATKEALKHMRAGKGPVMIEAEVYRYLHHSGGFAGSAFRYRSKEEEEQWKARDPLLRVAMEMKERKWLTDAEEEQIQNDVKAAMIEVAGRLTDGQYGKRSIIESLWPKPEFRDVGIRGDLSEFDGARFVEQSAFTGKLEPRKFIDIIADVMHKRMEEDPRIFCLGEDIHRLKGGTNGATRGLSERFTNRVLPTPITENSFVGAGGGAAMDGHFRPVIELMYPDFVLVAADQVFNQISRARHMYGGQTPMPVVLRTKVAMGTGYGSQHSMDPAGLYFNWPGWRIVAPSTPYDYVGLMNSALLCEDPVLVIEHVDLYNQIMDAPVEDLEFFIPLGKAKVIRSGSKFTVLTYLDMVHQCINVAEQHGFDAEVIDLRSLDRAGIDWDTVGNSIRKTNNVVIVEQGSVTASYGGNLSDEIQKRFFDYLDQPVKRVVGGEGSPSVSKVLENATISGRDEIIARFSEMVLEQGRPLQLVS